MIQDKKVVSIFGFGYARKSPDDKYKTESSITNQSQLIESTCKSKNWNFVDTWIDNNISGGDRQRPQFNKVIQAMIQHKQLHPEDEVYMIVKEQDRFARDSAFFSDTLRDLEIRGIRVFSIIKNNFLSYEDLGDVVTSVVDAHYIISQRKKSKVLFDQKKENGLPPIRPPYGYKMQIKIIDGNPKSTGKWVINRKRSKVVLDVVSSYLSNENYREVISRNKISKSLYYRIIDNSKKGLYSGLVVYSNKIRDSAKNVVREEIVKYLGLHEPILPENVSDKLGVIRDGLQS